MPDNRAHDVSAMTDSELERARRHLMVSLSLAFPGSPVRGPILAHISAIDAELAAAGKPASGHVTGTPLPVLRWNRGGACPARALSAYQEVTITARRALAQVRGMDGKTTARSDAGGVGA